MRWPDLRPGEHAGQDLEGSPIARCCYRARIASFLVITVSSKPTPRMQSTTRPFLFHPFGNALRKPRLGVLPLPGGKLRR
jgi:hypothetical protein